MKKLDNLKLRVCQSRAGVKKFSWDEYYDSIEEMLEDLKATPERNLNKVKGYQYLVSFKNQILGGRTLSEKQITMLKKLSSELIRARLFV